jgi:hypothetical protein
MSIAFKLQDFFYLFSTTLNSTLYKMKLIHLRFKIFVFFRYFIQSHIQVFINSNLVVYSLFERKYHLCLPEFLFLI